MSSSQQPQNKNANSDTARLETYIQMSYMSLGFATSVLPQIFKPSSQHPEPLLRKNVINRILFYRGRFDPPHTGHLAVLRHGFKAAGADLNTVAAVVIPMDVPESAKTWKRAWHAGKDASMWKPLSIEERARLWELADDGVAALPSYWVFDRPYHSFTFFRQQLIKNAASDGFEVELVGLVGPDHVFSGESKWKGRAGMLVTDVAREAPFFNYGVGVGVWGIPRALRGYCDWELREGEDEVWECRRRDDVRKFIRFVPKVDECGVTGEEVSGTRVREFLTFLPKEDSKKALKKVVLNVDILFDMLEGRKWFPC